MIKHSYYYSNIPEKQTSWIKTLLFLFENNKKQVINDFSREETKGYYQLNWDKLLKAIKENPDGIDKDLLEKIYNCKTGEEYINLILETNLNQVKEIEEIKKQSEENQINFLAEKLDDKNVFIVRDGKIYARQGGILIPKTFYLIDIFTVPVQEENQVVEDCLSLEDCIQRCKNANTVLSKKENKKISVFFNEFPDSIITFK